MAPDLELCPARLPDRLLGILGHQALEVGLRVSRLEPHGR